jgi:hypothetical protein
MYNPFKQLTDYLRYREAVKMADDAHAKDGDRYYVVASNQESGKPGLIVMDRKNFRKLKQKGYINKEANIRDLVAECFYCTPYLNGDGYLDANGRKLKLALYFSYCESIRMIAKQQKKQKKQKK